MSNIKQRIMQAKVDFINKNGREPKKIFLTAEDERQLGSLKAKDVGRKVAGELLIHDARKVFENGIVGIKEIVWGAKEFKIE